MYTLSYIIKKIKYSGFGVLRVKVNVYPNALGDPRSNPAYSHLTILLYFSHPLACLLSTDLLIKAGEAHKYIFKRRHPVFKL